MRIGLVETPEDLVGLRPHWDSLHEAAPQTSVFSSWDWQYHWWESYGRGRSLRIVWARDGETTLGLLPLYVEAEARGMGPRTQVLRFVGTGGDTHPDDLGPLLAPAREEEVAAALAEFVVTALPGWDVLHLSDMHPQSPLLAALGRQCRREAAPTSMGVSVRIPYLRLPATWEAYLQTLSRDRRWRLRRDRRKLEEGQSTRFFLWDDMGRVDEAVETLADLHRRRWRAAGQSHGFSSPEYVGFHRSVIRGCLARGWLRLYCLERAGHLIAMYYCYRFRNQVFLMQGGFDPDHAALNPGRVLMSYALEHAIGEGNTVFDFLRGEHQYKNELASDTRETVSFTAYRPGFRSLYYRAAHQYVPRARAVVKSMLQRLRLLPAPRPH